MEEAFEWKQIKMSPLAKWVVMRLMLSMCRKPVIVIRTLEVEYTSKLTPPIGDIMPNSIPYTEALIVDGGESLSARKELIVFEGEQDLS